MGLLKTATASIRRWGITPDFNRLWAGQIISEVGSGFGVLGLLAILHLNATPAQIGILESARSAPALLIGLFAGVWVDRVARRPLLLISDWGRALLLGLVVVAAFTGTLRIGHLYGVALLVGALTVLFQIAYHAYVPVLVGSEQLVSANSKLSASIAVAEIGSPGLGGLLVQLIGAPLTVLGDALTFVGSALWIGRIQTPEVKPAVERETVADLWREIGDGLGVVAHQPLLRALVIASAATNFFGGFFAANYSLFILRSLALSPALLGVFIGAGGIGALLGALLAERLSVRFGRRLLAIMLISGGIFAGLAPLATGQGLLVAFILLVVGQLAGDIFGSIYRILEVSTCQQLAPPQLLGRVNASFGFVTGGIGMIGILSGGWLGEQVGSGPTLLVAALGMALAGGWLFWQLSD